ncbi:unnamed protein product [Cladocopium goreaui]|uniref:Uncharacterized protein n=1 Tax=Cladocopium goreaui TaxID=2562237 RepID=A0A9P1D968_9DINO|nr:unnamed protein product [Cladocopium goreaui]
MAEPPESLKKAQLWAVEALAFAKEKVGTDSLLWGQQVIGTSSMFSGCGYGERALEYIHAARALHGKDLGSLTECLWTCEKNAAARSSHLDTLSVDACRFMDVFDFMSEDAVKEMKKVGTKSDVNRFKRWLTIGRKADLPTHAYCCQHLKKCPIRFALLNLSGSMCVAYSTLGNLQKLDDATAMLLVIYMMHNFRKRVWVLVHENVKGFLSDTLTDVAAEYGYDHFQIQCKPMDVGVHVGRPRKHLSNL